MRKSKYRKNVGIVLVNKKGQIWVGDISSSKCKDQFLQYHYQMPQGGIDDGETPEQAVIRELYEETGITQEKIELLKISSHWYRYDFPKWLSDKRSCTFKGQRQKWFLYRFLGEDRDFKLDAEKKPEFTGFKWLEPSDVLQYVIPFKLKVYQKVIQEFFQK